MKIWKIRSEKHLKITVFKGKQREIIRWKTSSHRFLFYKLNRIGHPNAAGKGPNIIFSFLIIPEKINIIIKWDGVIFLGFNTATSISNTNLCVRIFDITYKKLIIQHLANKW